MGENTGKAICLFGLSGDPPTGDKGHVGIVRALQQQNDWDEIWVLPVYRHTFLDKQNQLVSYEHRLAMAEAAFQEFASSLSKCKVIVSDAELYSWLRAVKEINDEEEKAKVSVGTSALLHYLRSKHDNTTTFYFCLGADAFLDLTAGKWKESTHVLRLLDGGKRLVVLHRKATASTSSIENEEQLLQRRIKETGARLMRIDGLGSISSSQVRACRDPKVVATMVAPRVLEYMQKHRLYLFAKNVDKE